MKLADLVFLVMFLAGGVTLVRLLLHVVRRRWREGRRLGLRLAGVSLVYLGLVVAVSLATPRRWVAVGEEQRFDDWSLTVERVEVVEGGYRLGLRVANRGRGRSQRAADAAVELVGADGRRYVSAAAPAARSLQSVLEPGESFLTVRTFEVPANASIIGADVMHGAWPQWFIVGDRGSLLHRRPLVRIDGSADRGR